MPEDAAKQTLEALNKGLGVLADKCMPAPDGKGFMGARCEDGGFFIQYFFDDKCGTQGKLPEELSK